MSSDIGERLRDAIDLLDLEGWLEQYVAVKSGGGSERRLESCPKCTNSEYKLYVNVDIKRWVCYVCGYGQHLADVVVLMSDVSGRSLFDIRKELLESNRPAPTGDIVQQLQAQFAPRRKPVEVVAEDVVLPGAADFTGVLGSRVLEYAYGRGLTPEELGLYRLRVARKLRRFEGPFIVFPSYYQGHVVGWQGRNVRPNVEYDGRYVSSDNVADWLWPLDNPFVAQLRYSQEVDLVEGVFDAIGLRRIGLPGFATFGKKISERQIATLKQIGVKTVRLMWDADAAVTSTKKLARGNYKRGLRGEIEEAAMRLKAHFSTMVVDLSNPPEFADAKKPDPGEILRVPAVAEWITERRNRAMDVNGIEFFQWRLGG